MKCILKIIQCIYPGHVGVIQKALKPIYYQPLEINDYIDNKIFVIDPFVSIDEGVEDLIEMAVLKGKKQNKNIKLGICGEHGGDPKSIEFCSRAGLNYVSCSPYRVPIARLAAAQAELMKK